MIFISPNHRILKKFQEKLHLFLHTLTILWSRHPAFNSLSHHNLPKHQSLKRNSSAQPWLNHQEFLLFLKEKLKDYYGSSLGKSFLRHYAPLIIKLSLLNLEWVYTDVIVQEFTQILNLHGAGIATGKSISMAVAYTKLLLLTALTISLSSLKWLKHKDTIAF